MSGIRLADIPWWAGLFRWVVIGSAALFVLGFRVDTQDRYDDERVPLSVVSRSADERSCVVAWRDPWDGSARSGGFRCSAGEAMVSAHWPWRGELYAVGGPAPRAPWAVPLAAAAVIALVSGVVLGIYRNFVW